MHTHGVLRHMRMILNGFVVNLKYITPYMSGY